jgi:hypothetical protein
MCAMVVGATGVAVLTDLADRLPKIAIELQLRNHVLLGTTTGLRPGRPTHRRPAAACWLQPPGYGSINAQSMGSKQPETDRGEDRADEQPGAALGPPVAAREPDGSRDREGEGERGEDVLGGRSGSSVTLSPCFSSLVRQRAAAR